jgi:hypothetical protein
MFALRHKKKTSGFGSSAQHAQLWKVGTIVLTPWNFSVVGNHKDNFPLSLLTKEKTREGMGSTTIITGSGKSF